MSAEFKVLWTDRAADDLTDIIQYIAEDSQQNAGIVFGRIRSATAELAHIPERGRIVPELFSLGITLYRELIVSPWRVIYRISDKTVFVLAVIDSRRDVEDLLLKKLINQ